MLKLGDIVFRGSSHTLQHTDGYLRYDSRRQITPNLENSPINVGYQNRFYPPPPSYATETSAIYHRMIHDAYQFVYGIYGEVDAYQSLTGGSFTKVIHKGKGDAHYVALMRPGTPDPGGFGYEAAMFTNGGNGFIATLQGQLGFPDSEPNQNNAVGFQALWGDDGIDPGFVPNYGMFYANNSPGHALMARLNQFADPGVPQIMVTESSFRIRNAIFGSGATHLYGDAATALSINKQSPDLVLRGHFWDGVNSISIERQSLLRTVVSVLGRPQMYHYFGAPGLETLGMISDAYGLDLQGHALTGIASITAAIGGMTLDFQGGDIVSLDDITFSGSGSLVDLQGGRITGGGGSLNLGGAATSTHAIGAGSVLVGGALEVDGTSWIDGYAAFSGGIGIEGTTATTGRIYNPGAAPLNLGVNAITSHSLGTNDVMVGGALEVNGRIWADGDITTNTLTTTALLGSAGIVFTNSPFFFSSGEQSVGMALNSTFDQFVFATNFLSGRAVLFIDTANYLLDYLHPVQAHPTVFVHSITSPSVATDQWLGLTHRETDGYIETGAGSIIMAPFDGYVSPARDDGYSLGSPTQRWKELWLGPDSLHIHSNTGETGIEMDWNVGMDGAGSLSFRQGSSNAVKIRHTGHILAPDGSIDSPSYSFANDTDVGLIRVGANNPAIVGNQINFYSASGANLFQFTSASILFGGGNLVINSSGGYQAASGGYQAWLFQQQDGVASARVIGSANAVNEYAVRVGTKYTAAEGGDLATLLQVGLNIDSSPMVSTAEFYGDGRLALFSPANTGHAIILRHTGQDGYIQTTLGHISLAPQDGYVNPMTDDAYSLGSPTQRWRELWLGPNSLHIHKPADVNGIERDWRLGIGDAGSFVLKQGNDQGLLITPQNIGSLALGYKASVSNGSFHTAIGSGATASNVNNFNIAIGYNASSTGPGDHVIGTIASASGGSSVVIGYTATSNASQSTVIGYQASVTGGQGIAIGYNTSAGAAAIAIGSSAPAIGASAVAIGVGTGGAGAGTTTVGTGIANGSTDSVAIGANAGSSADRGITIGNASSALSSIGNGTGSISMGYLAASDGGGIAIGYQASSNYNQVNRSIAIGYNATTLSFANSLAIGESARPAEHNQAQFGTIAEPLNTIIYGNYLSLNNNNKSITLRHINNDGYIQTTSGHLILSPADGEVVPGGDGYGFGNPNNRWYDGYFTDTNTRGLVTDIVHIISANSPYTAKQSNYTILGNATGGNIVVNLPGAGGANRGRIYNIKKTDSSGNTVTIQPTGAQTIDGTNPVTLGTQNHSRQIQSDGLNWYVIGGVF